METGPPATCAETIDRLTIALKRRTGSVPEKYRLIHVDDLAVALHFLKNPPSRRR
jgi:hypothetical protein